MIQASAAPSLNRRAMTIEQSGWGRSFTFTQPRNAAFWTYLILVIAGTAIFTERVVALAGNARFGPAIAVSAVLFGVYGALLWWFAQRIDRYSSLPGRLKVAAFVWGGCAATWAMARNANIALHGIYAKLLGSSFAIDWGAGLAAPFTEEAAKAAGLVLLILLAPRLIKTAFDGFIVGAFLGLGFQTFENVWYAINASSDAFGSRALASTLRIVGLRTAVGFASHILYSSILCAGLVYLLGRSGQPRRVARGLLLIAIPVAIHFVWDSGVALAGSNVFLFPLIQVGIFVLALVIVVQVFRMTVSAERQQLRDVLAPEVENGTLTADELDAVTGDRKARKRYRKGAHGHQQRRARQHVLDGAIDLAHALAHGRGDNTPWVMFARQEVSRMRRV